MLSSFSLLAVYLLAFVSSAKVIDVSGAGWIVQNSNGSITVPGRVPSDQYLDLYDSGVIGNPLYGFNDTAQMWVQLDNWTYTSPPIKGLGSGNTTTWLVFEGLDTFAHISLCGHEVGNTNNQFRQWLFEVTDILRFCANETRLAINFGSAIEITNAIANSSAADPNVNFANTCNGTQVLGCKPYARKEQNDFGWDWSPSLGPAGPWRPIYVVQLDQLQEPVYANNALIDIYRQGQMNNIPPDQSKPWVFNASIDFIGHLPADAALSMTLKDATGSTFIQKTLDGVYHNNQTITGSTIIGSAEVKSWWPAGMGDQILYNATISIVSSQNVSVAEVERRVGFRTIVLNLLPITDEQLAAGIAPGANWHFEINGHEMYAKGSNLVPPDTFWPRVNETHMRQLFELVTGGNQNMLRLWSSGAYLDEWIYDIADEMGILLWSEFEFSDAEYSNSTDSLENYQAEAYYNVRRVNHHPSLALWAGGNELEAIQLALFFNATDPSSIMLEYQQIFEELLIKCVYANTRSISYIPSSTYNGFLSLDFNSTRPQTPRYLNGTSPNAFYNNTDSYNYDASTAFNLSGYPVGRFADEFGFISMPSLQTWEEAAPQSDLYLESPTVVHHNRHTPFGATLTNESSLTGIYEMVSGVELWYPTPKLSDPIANFTAWIYSTQVFQADIYQHQIAFYRRGSGMRERQLGSLYWQLEDLWAAPTWSSIEANNRQKLTYYITKDIFKPVIVYAYYNDSTADTQVWVTSDLWLSVSGTVEYEWIDFAGTSLSVSSNSTNSTRSYGNGNANNYTTSLPFTVGPINATKVIEWENVNNTLTSSGYNTSNAILRLSVTGSYQGYGGESYTHSHYFHPGSLADAPLQDPGLTLSQTGSESNVQFTLQATKAVAAWVWIDYASTAVQGYWSDNGFWLNKGESKTVTFTVWNDWSSGEWVDTVSVRSLWNNTAPT